MREVRTLTRTMRQVRNKTNHRSQTNETLHASVPSELVDSVTPRATNSDRSVERLDDPTIPTRSVILFRSYQNQKETKKAKHPAFTPGVFMRCWNVPDITKLFCLTPTRATPVPTETNSQLIKLKAS